MVSFHNSLLVGFYACEIFPSLCSTKGTEKSGNFLLYERQKCARNRGERRKFSELSGVCHVSAKSRLHVVSSLLCKHEGIRSLSSYGEFAFRGTGCNHKGSTSTTCTYTTGFATHQSVNATDSDTRCCRCATVSVTHGH